MPETAEAPAVARVDEAAKRRPDWVEGVAFRMTADGQDWHLPRVVVGYQVRLRPGGDDTIRPVLATTETNRRFGARFRDHQAAVAQAIDSGLPSDLMQAIAEAFADLVRRNYAMTDDEIESLTVVYPGNPEDIQLWRSIADHVLSDPLPPAFPAEVPVREGGADAPGN